MIKYVAGVLLVPFFVGVGWLGIQIADRRLPVVDARVVIVPNEIEPGKPMQVDVRVFYKFSCSTYISRHLYDHTGAVFTAPELTLPPSQIGLVHSASTVPLPLAFAPGEGRLESDPSYGCNWVQRHFWPVHAPIRVVTFFAVPAKVPEGDLQ